MYVCVRNKKCMVMKSKLKRCVQTKIETTYVIVQGQPDIFNSKTVSPDHQSVKFVLTGSTDITWKSSENPEPCSGSSDGECNLGKKPFVVAGGKLNIQALPSSCVTKTVVKDKIYTKPVWVASDFDAFEHALLENMPHNFWNVLLQFDPT